MSKAPERIGLVPNGLGGFALWNREDNKFDPAIEYIRADLFDAVKAERDALEALYEAERDDELLNIARQAGYQDGAEDRRKLEARVKALSEALKPFSYCIFDDNGDVTILTANLKTQDWLEARAALQENTDDR